MSKPIRSTTITVVIIIITIIIILKFHFHKIPNFLGPCIVYRLNEFYFRYKYNLITNFDVTVVTVSNNCWIVSYSRISDGIQI